jgi:hypothetical protein
MFKQRETKKRFWFTFIRPTEPTLFMIDCPKNGEKVGTKKGFFLSLAQNNGKLFHLSKSGKGEVCRSKGRQQEAIL